MASYYKEIVSITRDYLGPAAERFVDRQIRLHLEKDAKRLTPTDVIKLSHWTKTALNLLTHDKAQAAEAAARIEGVVK
jgi:pyridoxine 5'-phosphate synthase PdxJ